MTLRLKAIVLMGIILVICLAASSGAETWRQRLENTNITLFSKPAGADSLNLRDIDGNTVNLRSLKGKLVLLNFWQIDCVPCAMEKMILERIYREFKEDGLEVVAVNLEDQYYNVIPFAKKQGYSFKVAYDPDDRYQIQTRETELSDITSFVINPMSKAIYEVPAMPTTYIINPKGRVIGRAVGMVNWSKAPFRDFLAHLTPGNSQGRRVKSGIDRKRANSASQGPDDEMNTPENPHNEHMGQNLSALVNKPRGRRLLAQAPMNNRGRNVGPPRGQLPPARPVGPQNSQPPGRQSPRPNPGSQSSGTGATAHEIIPLPRALPYTPPGAASTPVRREPPATQAPKPEIAPDQDGYVMATIPGGEPKPLKPGAGHGAGDSPVASPVERFILDAFDSPSQQRVQKAPGAGATRNSQSQGTSGVGNITEGIRSVISAINPFK